MSTTETIPAHDRKGPDGGLCYTCRDYGHDWTGDGTPCGCCGHPYPAVWVWADRVAPLLEPAGSWRAEHDQMHGARFVGPDGVTVWVSAHTYGYVDPSRIRVEVSAGIPSGADYSQGDYGRGEIRPEVTVGMSRPVESAARDISRRLLSDAVTYWHTVAERVAARTARADSQRDHTARYAELIGGRAGETYRDGWRVTLDLSAGYGDATVDSDGDVRIELRGIPWERAAELAAIVRTWAR